VFVVPANDLDGVKKNNVIRQQEEKEEEEEIWCEGEKSPSFARAEKKDSLLSPHTPSS